MTYWGRQTCSQISQLTTSIRALLNRLAVRRMRALHAYSALARSEPDKGRARSGLAQRLKSRPLIDRGTRSRAL